MLRVGNLDKSLAFYQDVLGMKLLRRRLHEENSTLAFVGYGDGERHAQAHTIGTPNATIWQCLQPHRHQKIGRCTAAY